MGEQMKGKPNLRCLGKRWKLSEETKAHFKELKRDYIPKCAGWNKGLLNRIPREKMNKIQRNNALAEWRKLGGAPWNKGSKYSDERRQQMREIAVANPNRKFKDTSIEVAIEEELKARALNYQKQVPLCKIGVVDFFIPERNLVIQCDGDYWHNRECSKVRDAMQNEVLRKNGYTVFRFWEHEIKRSSKECVDKIYA